MSSVARSATIVASPDAVWTVLADFGALAAWVPMIQHSCLLSEQTHGIGTVRRVQIASRTLVERVTTWRPGDELAYTIDGLPPFVGPARATWTITPTIASISSSAVTGVTVTTEVDPGRNVVKALIARQALARMALVSDAVLVGLASALTPAAPS